MRSLMGFLVLIVLASSQNVIATEPQFVENLPDNTRLVFHSRIEMPAGHSSIQFEKTNGTYCSLVYYDSPDSRFVSAGTELFLSRWSRVDHDGFSFDVAKESDSNLNDMWLYCFDLDSTNNARDLTYESLKKVLGQKNIELALPEPVEY